MTPTDTQSICFTVIIVAIVFMVFYNAPAPGYRGTECSARKSNVDEDTPEAISARKSVTSPVDKKMGEIVDQDAFDSFFQNQTAPSEKSPAEIAAATDRVRAEAVETTHTKSIGTPIAVPFRDISQDTKPSKPPDCMLFNIPLAAEDAMGK